MKIGIISGGQLARMLALSGYPFGMTFRFFDPSPAACAGDVGELFTGGYGDHEALKRFADGLDVLTCEFENVPAETLAVLSNHVPVLPRPEVYQVAQDRLREKELFTKLGIPVAPYQPVSTLEELRTGVSHIGLPAILKTRRLGYDGKGQVVLNEHSDIESAWKSIGEKPAILEAKIAFDCEVSQIAVRARSGAVLSYSLAENIHRAGILRVTTAPTHQQRAVGERAASATTKILEELDYVGVIAVEFFVKGSDLYANELAPRVHNTGHWTIEGAQTSQFENHLRSVAGLPLGSTAPVGFSRMFNLIGSHPPVPDICAIPEAHLHLYRKSHAPGRKIGHVTVRESSGERLDEVSRSLAGVLNLSEIW